MMQNTPINRPGFVLPKPGLDYRNRLPGGGRDNRPTGPYLMPPGMGLAPPRMTPGESESEGRRFRDTIARARERWANPALRPPAAGASRPGFGWPPTPMPVPGAQASQGGAPASGADFNWSGVRQQWGR